MVNVTLTFENSPWTFEKTLMNSQEFFPWTFDKSYGLLRKKILNIWKKNLWISVKIHEKFLIFIKKSSMKCWKIHRSAQKSIRNFWKDFSEPLEIVSWICGRSFQNIWKKSPEVFEKVPWTFENFLNLWKKVTSGKISEFQEKRRLKLRMFWKKCLEF